MSMLRDPALRQLYAFALDMLQVSGRVDVPACLDHGPAEIRQEVARALMDGRWEGVVAAEDAMHALLLKLQRSRVDSELADAQRQHREAMARGDEQEARAISIREMDLIRAKLGLANHDKGMAT
jgi:uncharacterized protein YqfA (UPF0365 family)